MQITFEDIGQPYTLWEIDSNGQIINCLPNLGFYWIGKYVVAPESLRVGQHLYYCNTPITLNTPINHLKPLRHKIASIQKTWRL